MESGIFEFVLRYSKRQQLFLLAVTAISFPFLYMSFDLPKTIINEAIAGTEFPQTLFGVDLEQIPYLWVLCVIFLSLVLINGVFKLWINIYRGALGERMLRRLRYQLVELVMRFPLPHFRNVSQGEVVSIITTETEPLGGFIGESLSLPAFQGGTLLTILAFMFVQDWALGLAAIALYPIQMYAIPKLQRQVNLLAKERVAKVRNLSERVSELVSGIHEVHANDTSQYELADFSSRLGRIFGIRYNLYRKKFFIKFLNNFIAQLTPFFFFSIGGYLVIEGDLSFGALVATLGAYKDLSSPWKELLTYYQKMEDSKIKYQQLVERFQPPGMIDASMLAPRETVDIELSGQVIANNLTLEEDEGTKVVAGASFSFDVSDHVAIVGPPGSGKGEIAKLISRQLFPTGGSVAVGGVNLSEVPEAVVGRQMSYVDPEVYITAGTIRDNLYYVLKNYPRAPADGEDDSERERREAESELAGNSTLDVNADWIDYASIGVDGPEGLTRKAVEILKIVGLEQDVFELGLRRVIDPEAHPDLAKGILKARKMVHERLGDPSISGLVQVFDKDAYNLNASVAENILFGTPVGDYFRIENLGDNPYVAEVLEKVGLTDTFLEMGLNIATLMVDLFKDLPPGHEFFERFSFIEEEALQDFQRIINHAGNKGLEALAEEDREQLTDLPFKLIVARHRVDLIDDAMQERLLEARRVFAEELPEDLRGSVEFFDVENYNAAGSILDNALFGKVASEKADSQHRVVELVTQAIDDLGLRIGALEAGLDYNVGIGGKRLTPVQRQRLGLARGLIKESRMMIVNEAAAMLAKPDQQELLAAIKTATTDRGLVWIADDPEAAQNFDIVMMVEGGRVREETDAVKTKDTAAPKPTEEVGNGTSELGQEAELLAGIPFFAGLDRSKLKLLAFASARQVLEPNEVLFEQGGVGDMAYVLVDGECDILVSTTEGQVKVASARTGDVIGELALLCDAPRTATIKAVSALTVLRITKDVFLQLVRDNAEVGESLTRIVAGKLERMMRDFVGGSPTLYDEPTGLPNLNLFLDRIENAVHTDERDEKISSMMLLDISTVFDGLDALDDAARILVVKEVANRLREKLRKSDSVARLGDLVFGIITKSNKDSDGIDVVTSRLHEAFNDPIVVGDDVLSATKSFMIDTYTLDKESAGTVVEKVKDHVNAG